jgi:hypothetical protein
MRSHSRDPHPKERSPQLQSELLVALKSPDRRSASPRTNHQDVAQVKPSTAQNPQGFTNAEVAQVQKSQRQSPKDNDHQSGQNQIADQKNQPEKDQQSQERSPNQINDLAPAARDPTRAVKIEYFKDST